MKTDPRKMQADFANTLLEFNRFLRVAFLAAKPQGNPEEHPQIKANNALVAKYGLEPLEFEIPK